MGHRRTVQPGPHGDPGLRQTGGGLLAVEVPAAERQNAALPRPREHLHARQLPKAARRKGRECALLRQQLFRPPLAHKAQASQQAADAADVVRARLVAVRQEIRHALTERIAPRAALQQRLPRLAAQQQARPLRAIQPLVPRHGNEGRARPMQTDRQRSRGLRSIDDERDAAFPAQRGNG